MHREHITESDENNQARCEYVLISSALTSLSTTALQNRHCFHLNF